MRIANAFLAEQAGLVNGWPVIQGAFVRSIRSAQLPCLLPIALVIEFEWAPDECDVTYDCQISVLDPDEQALADAAMEMTPEAFLIGPGETVARGVITNTFTELVVEQYGTHHFIVEVDGEEVCALPFTISALVPDFVPEGL